ncbi:MAG: PEP-CTERM sorting domain-containing protein [Thiobacillus sp.]|nr:PEP-CTERM sorting domain-containing protein [Thiobacillus sp.]
MKQITAILAGAGLSCCMASSLTLAASIQSLTIEEIGVSSAGLGTSAMYAGGGFGDWIPSSGVYTPAPAFFVSAGSTDNAMVMGTAQGNGKFTLGTSWGGNSVLLNTLHGAPTGTIEQGVMTLDLSGLLAEFPVIDLTFKVAPDTGTLFTSVWAIDATHYYYTADWTQFIDGDGDVYQTSSGIWAMGWEGSTVVMHLEGIATLAPVPEADTYAMMLAGLGLVGFMAHRRRKSA